MISPARSALTMVEVRFTAQLELFLESKTPDFHIWNRAYAAGPTSPVRSVRRSFLSQIRFPSMSRTYSWSLDRAERLKFDLIEHSKIQERRLVDDH